MRFHLRIPHFGGSTIETAQQRARPVLDGSDVVVPNRWNLPPHTVALVGRPAVWLAFDLETPRLPLGFTTLESRKLHWEQDFGGHLFLAITGPDASKATIIEAGPTHPNGTGALVPYAYPEDAFAERGALDFKPLVIAPPNGLSEESFARLVRTTQQSYDGDQRYLVIEMPFLRVGRDSNSYAVGVLLCCGIDPREIPKRPGGAMRYEWTGYPGAEDPVHRENFGMYPGTPSPLDANGAIDVAMHNDDGSVRLVVVGGEPNADVRLPDGTPVTLNALGRIVFAPDDARRHGLPSRHTEPPAHIQSRRRFPPDPAPAGALITLVVDDRPRPLAPGTSYRGTIAARHDAVGLATLRCATNDVVLPLVELGVELRDPKRVDQLFRVGQELTVGLHRDRHPRLIAHGDAFIKDRLTWRRFHAPRRINLLGTGAVASVVLGGGLLLWRRRAS